MVVRYPVSLTAPRDICQRSFMQWNQVHNKYTNSLLLTSLPLLTPFPNTSRTERPWCHDLSTLFGPWHVLCIRRQTKVNTTAVFVIKNKTKLETQMLINMRMDTDINSYNIILYRSEHPIHNIEWKANH